MGEHSSGGTQNFPKTAIMGYIRTTGYVLASYCDNGKMETTKNVLRDDVFPLGTQALE